LCEDVLAKESGTAQPPTDHQHGLRYTQHLRLVAPEVAVPRRELAPTTQDSRLQLQTVKRDSDAALAVRISEKVGTYSRELRDTQPRKMPHSHTRDTHLALFTPRLLCDLTPHTEHPRRESLLRPGIH